MLDVLGNEHTGWMPTHTHTHKHTRTDTHARDNLLRLSLKQHGQGKHSGLCEANGTKRKKRRTGVRMEEGGAKECGERKETAPHSLSNELLVNLRAPRLPSCSCAAFFFSFFEAAVVNTTRSASVTVKSEAPQPTRCTHTRTLQSPLPPAGRGQAAPVRLSARIGQEAQVRVREGRDRGRG